MLLVNRRWRDSPFPPSSPRVFVLCCTMHFPLIFNYSKAGRSPAGLSLRCRLAKPGPASWLGTKVTRLWSAALAGAPTSGEFGCRDTGSWGTPALAPHLLPISQPGNVTLALRFGCTQPGIIRLIINIINGKLQWKIESQFLMCFITPDY